MWMSILLLIPIILYIYNQWAFGYWKRKGVFQIDGTFLFGNIREVLFLKKSLPEVTSEMYKKYKEKGLIGFYSFYKPVVLVTDPRLVKQALITDFNNFSGTGFIVDEKTDPMLALNPFGTRDFETWKERRGLHVSLHTPAKLKLVPGTITKVGHNMIKHIMQAPNTTVNLTELAQFFSLDAITSSGFGMEPLAFVDQNSLIPTNVKEVLAPSADNAFNCAYLYPCVARLFSIRTISTKCQKFFEELTPQLLSQREKSAITRGDVIDALLKLEKKKNSEGKQGLPDIEKTGHVVAAFLDSYVTTSLGLQSFLEELANNPEEQEKVRDEIAAVGNKIEDFDFDTVNSLKYLQMALNESLRLHTILAIIARTCSKTSKLGEVTIEKGTKLLFPAKSFHMDPDYYPEPEKYSPQRFSDDHVKGLFLPFGDGPRMCLGNRYAQLVMKLAAINILLKFRMLPTKKKENKNSTEGDQLFSHSLVEELVTFQPL